MSSLAKSARLLVNLLRIAISNPKRLSHVLGTALSVSREVADKDHDLLAIPNVTVEDLLPSEGAPEGRIAFFPRTSASISVFECVSLALLMRKVNARQVFEFGTYKGVSVTQLALNLPEGGRAYTLDLPEGQAATKLEITFQKDSSIAFEAGKGSLVPASLLSRIEFLRADSAEFDPAPFKKSIDLVFVDGAHNYDYVKNDSEKGWEMLREGGIMVWHDFSVTDLDVVRFLLSSSYQPKRIVGTAFAFAQKPPAPADGKAKVR